MVNFGKFLFQAPFNSMGQKRAGSHCKQSGMDYFLIPQLATKYRFKYLGNSSLSLTLSIKESRDPAGEMPGLKPNRQDFNSGPSRAIKDRGRSDLLII